MTEVDLDYYGYIRSCPRCETIERLLGETSGSTWTEEEIRELANEQISERVVPEAQR